MRVIVCGGRDFSDKHFVYAALDAVHAKKCISLIIHGDATGADKLSGQWAKERGVEVLPMAAQWKQFGRRAGPLRNGDMLKQNPDGVVAFPGGRGTQDMVNQAHAAGVKVWQPRMVIE